MRRRRLSGGRALGRWALVVFGAALLSAPTAMSATAPAASPPEQLMGRGIDADLALCIGCSALIVGLSGGSLGGFFLAGSLYPQFYAGCATSCILAVS